MPNKDLSIDQEGVDFITRWEGLRLKPYFCTAGKLTVGVGHVVRPGEPYREGVAITQEEAERLLRQDVTVAEQAIRKHVRVQLTQPQFNALVSFVFNCGTKWISEGSVHSAVNEGRFGDVPAALAKFNKVGGTKKLEDGSVVSALVADKGLTARRADEGRLFLSKPGAMTVSASSFESVQRALIKLGYDLGSSGADGRPGPRSTAAIQAFQQSAGLTADGKVGPKTVAALQTAVDALAS